MEDQFTIGRSRASEITMAEEAGPSAGDLYGEFDLGAGGFGGEAMCTRRVITNSHGQLTIGLQKV